MVIFFFLPKQHLHLHNAPLNRCYVQGHAAFSHYESRAWWSEMERQSLIQFIKQKAHALIEKKHLVNTDTKHKDSTKQMGLCHSGTAAIAAGKLLE